MMNSNTAYLFDEKDEGSLEKNHTHFLLLDDGRYKRSQSCNETNEQSMIVTSQRSESVGENQQHQRGSMIINIKIIFYWFLFIYFYSELE